MICMICVGSFLSGTIVLRLRFEANWEVNTGVPMAGTPNWLLLAIFAAVTALFSECTLEFWGSFTGSLYFGAVKCCEIFVDTCRVVEFLDCSSSTTGTWYVATPVVQEAEIVVLLWLSLYREPYCLSFLMQLNLS